MKVARVKGLSHLGRDLRSRAIVNTDRDAFRAAKRRKQEILDQKQKMIDLEEKVNHLEEMIEKLLSASNGDLNEKT